MPKYEATLTGDFDELLALLHRGILDGSFSATFEDCSEVKSGNFRCAVRVYERYSMMGGNRVSMNITLLDDSDELHVIAITAGGSQAMFFKFNTLGEGDFLRHAEDIVEEYKKTQRRKQSIDQRTNAFISPRPPADQ